MAKGSRSSRSTGVARARAARQRYELYKKRRAAGIKAAETRTERARAGLYGPVAFQAQVRRDLAAYEERKKFRVRHNQQGMRELALQFDDARDIAQQLVQAELDGRFDARARALAGDYGMTVREIYTLWYYL